jgi:hypothetical protein
MSTYFLRYLFLCILLSAFPYAIIKSFNFKDDHTFLLTVVIMVKDEAEVIIPTLQPFVDAGIKSFLVYDTGSTDGTQNIIAHYFQENNITHGYIIEEPFIDFATSRNRALDLAEEIFINNRFLLMLDAEWYIHDVKELINYCKQHEHYIDPRCTGGCYLMRLLTVQDNINNYVPRLFRQGYNSRYVGVVHESIPESPSGILPDSVFFEYKPQQYGREKSHARCARDYALLKKSLENNPSNMRTLFYLAQTCQFMDDWEQAIFYYQKRLDVGAVSEEKYLAAYRIACAIEHILAESYENGTSTHYTQEDAVNYYLQAYNLAPYRAESLFRIACYYIRRNQHAIGYLFAKRAVELPYPPSALFVEKSIYEYLRYDILGQCALYVGEYEIGKTAILQALEYEPNAEHLHHNLAAYECCFGNQ